MGKIRNIIACSALGMMMAAVLCGCGKDKKEVPAIQLSLWTDERNEASLREELAQFQDMYKEDAIFDFTISMEGEDTCKATVLSNPEGAADIFIFADDQMEELYRGGALLEITQNVDQILNSVGGRETSAAKAALREDKLYAYPVTSGNGYYLYYNKNFLSEDDVKSLDQILEVCERENKKFTMDYSSGWYLYSFFKAAGLELTCNEEGNQNICNWNATDTKFKGIDVAQSMLKLSSDPCFVSLDDAGFVRALQEGEVIAGINGPWNAERVSAAWGDGYAATKLPTYTLGEEQIQMCSFAGYKLMGINAHTEHPQWCMLLAEYLTNDENQLQRFDDTGECPASLTAAATEEVQVSPAVAALAEQAPYSYIQSVADPFWKAATKYGIVLAAGNPDGRDLQELLDELQKEIVTPSSLGK